MRTGTRCAIFTQLPVAFCGGSSEKAVPVPPLMLSTVPRKLLSGIHVDLDVYFLTDMDADQLGFLEVGIDVETVICDECKQRHANADQ